MSALAWLFGLAGLAVVLPIAFHLIQRAPRDQQPFSSLMFLEPSPPRLTKRSRLDDLLLLLLRCAAILAIAAAFTRPFFRSSELLEGDENAGRKILIALDTSASMQRLGVWEASRRAVAEAIEAAEPEDRVALLTFDRRPVMAVDWTTDDEVLNRESILKRLDEIEPSWFGTSLDEALIMASDRLTAPLEDGEAAPSGRQIILISDLQDGASRDRLQGVEWPPDVMVSVRTVGPNNPSNASVRPLVIDEADRTDDELVVVRISNAAESTAEQFRVQWFAEGEAVDEGAVVDVAAGKSLVVELKRPANASALAIVGDAATFDNIFSLPPLRPRTIAAAAYSTEDISDAEGPFFYLRAALADGRRRSINWASDEPPKLIFLNDPEQAALAADQVKAGATAIVVVESAEAASTLEPLIGSVRSVQPVRETDLLLAEIRFKDRTFEPFRQPRYSDFTDVRFWRATPRQPDDGSDAVVLATLDNDVPLLWRRPLGAGTVFAFTAGWQPTDSQLALSNKFVPLMEQIVAAALPSLPPPAGYATGEPIPLPADAIIRDQNGEIVRGDGDAADDARRNVFVADTPGLYEQTVGAETSAIAFNVPADESRTDPIAVSQLAQFGVLLGESPPPSETAQQRRKQRDRELEQQQKVWKWLIIAAIICLAAEMAVSSYRLSAERQPVRT